MASFCLEACWSFCALCPAARNRSPSRAVTVHPSRLMPNLSTIDRPRGVGSNPTPVLSLSSPATDSFPNVTCNLLRQSSGPPCVCHKPSEQDRPFPRRRLAVLAISASKVRASREHAFVHFLYDHVFSSRWSGEANGVLCADPRSVSARGSTLRTHRA